MQFMDQKNAHRRLKTQNAKTKSAKKNTAHRLKYASHRQKKIMSASKRKCNSGPKTNSCNRFKNVTY